MFRIALIQNQSEMAHYGYADARPLLEDFGYAVELYTADNIDALGSALTRNQYDAIVFGSNALNDKTIRLETQREQFQSAFRSWLQKGRGCLCLHQLKLATLEEPTLAFLPPRLKSVAASIRPPTEKSADGAVDYAPNASDHILLLYPHEVSPGDVQRNATGFKSLPGLYWHSWSDVNLAEWEELLVDPSAQPNPRPLLISAREPREFRVIASSLTLDWQKQRDLLQNLLIYVVEGKHNTAVLLDEDNRNTAFDYLLGTLESRRYPFKKYFRGQDHTILLRNIKNGVHSVLVLGPFVVFDRLPEELSSAVVNRVSSGHLKLITTASDHPVRRFSVAGRERLALRLLQDAELKIQAELRKGYIDGSFWSTAETLQTLESLPESRANYVGLVKQALSRADEHDRDGSYDEVFGVSCAFLWMRGRFLGIHDDKTHATAAWIRSRIDNYEAREQALAYLTLAQLELLEISERKDLTGLLASLDPKRLSEIDLVVYMRSALIAQHVAVIPGLVTALQEKQRNGAWIDLATTATAVATLIEALDQLRSGGTSYGSLKTTIERMVFGGIIYIQEALERSRDADEGTDYPWDGKASTTAKCIQAWLRFEELVDLPVHELVDTLERYNEAATSLLAGGQALSVLEVLKQDNASLRSDLIDKESKLQKETEDHERTQRKAKRALYAITPLTLSLYFLIALSTGTIFHGGLNELLEIMRMTFIDGWGFHVALLGLLGAYLGLPWRKWLGWENATRA